MCQILSLGALLLALALSLLVVIVTCEKASTHDASFMREMSFDKNAPPLRIVGQPLENLSLRDLCTIVVTSSDTITLLRSQEQQYRNTPSHLWPSSLVFKNKSRSTMNSVYIPWAYPITVPVTVDDNG